MKVSLATGNISKHDCDVLVLPVFESDISDPKARLKALAAVDEALDGLLLSTAAEEDVKAKPDSTLMFHTHGKISAKRVLLLGLGQRRKFEPETLRQAAGRAVKAAGRVSGKTVALALTETREFENCVKAAGEGFLMGAYKFDKYKGGEKKAKDAKEDKKEAKVSDVRLFLPENMSKTKELEGTLALGLSVAAATNWARDAVNEPANVLTPTVLANLAKTVAKEGGLKIEVLERAEIEKLGMGMFLGVARGSVEAPKLIHMWFEPAGKEDRKKAPLALIGKAITFDSGGYSLKPTEGMVDMKTDMAGSAAVFGAMKVIAELKPNFPVHAFVGACENMLSGNAYRPGDVLTSKSGKTVEITNTDAEGRLVLGDVITWAREFKPAAMIDLATLTGACVVALGHYITGAFSEADATIWAVLEAARSAGEEMWRLPISEHQRDNLKSEIADLKNSGERWGGAINAALFLKEFAGETPWVHLDIAGPSQSPKERGYLTKGGTGCGVRTLVEFVRGRMKEGVAGCEEAQG